MSDFTTTTQDGDLPVIDFTLVGRWDCDVERGYTFTYDGDNYVVDSIDISTKDRSRTDRVVAQVTAYIEGGFRWE